MEAPAPCLRAAAAQRRREATRRVGKGASRCGCAETPARRLCPRYTGSRALIGVVVEAANDGGHPRFGADEMIAAVASACSTVWKRAGPLKTLAALLVSGISPSRPNGLVQSNPVLAPVRRPLSEGSIVIPSIPCRIMRS